MQHSFNGFMGNIHILLLALQMKSFIYLHIIMQGKLLISVFSEQSFPKVLSCNEVMGPALNTGVARMVLGKFVVVLLSLFNGDYFCFKIVKF